jgi:ATP/ADP translocase
MNVGQGRFAAIVAAAGATLMIGAQVSSKAMRDALFLENFSIESLATMLFAAAVVSFAGLLWASRAMAEKSPERVIPVVFVASGLLFGFEWLLLGWLAPLAAVMVYLHVATFGSLLVSGFWSIVNERFDPRTARRRISMIAGGGALGGLCGGLAAERAGAFGVVDLMLPAMGFMHLAAGFLLIALGALPDGARGRDSRDGADGGAREEGRPPGALDGLRQVFGAPYLRNLALLILTTTASATLVDYVFKARALEVYVEGEALVRFFAVFYAAVGFVTFLLQSLFAGRALERMGPAGTVVLLPAALAAGSIALVLVPGLAVAGAARGGETSLRGSLFRSGYELLYTPIPPEQKRSAKPIVDVGVDRLGDASSAVLIGVLLGLVPAFRFRALAVAAAVLAAAAGVIAIRLRRNYLAALKSRLVDSAGELELDSTRPGNSVAMQSLGKIDVSRVATGAITARPAPSREIGVDSGSDRDDPIVLAILDLRSGSAERIRSCLAKGLDTETAGHAIGLLSRHDVADEVIDALGPLAGKVAGQLADWLRDPETVFAIRRRIPRVLARADSPRGVQGLVDGLGDPRFEVRYQCAAALEKIRNRDERIPVDAATIHRTVIHELGLDAPERLSHSLLDTDRTIRLDSLLADRIDLGLEHVFRLLGFVYEREPLEVALRALHTSDPQMRGTALEYLEGTLPAAIFEPLSPFFEDVPGPTRVSASDARTALLDLNDSIRRHLEELEQKR